MGLPAPDGTATWNGRVPPRGGVVGMIESAAQQLDLTGGEGAERGVGASAGAGGGCGRRRTS